MQIISHNSVNVHRIPTTVGTEICLNEPFKYTKFQPNWSMHLWILRSVRKEEAEKNLNFGHSYLGNGWSDFLQMWECGLPYLAGMSLVLIG